MSYGAATRIELHSEHGDALVSLDSDPANLAPTLKTRLHATISKLRRARRRPQPASTATTDTGGAANPHGGLQPTGLDVNLLVA
jgi:hypothetical protein